MAKAKNSQPVTKAGELIISGPNFESFIKSLKSRKSKVFVKFTTKSGQWLHIVITGLKQCGLIDPFCPHPDLSAKEMEELLGKSFDWDNSWWFEGYSNCPVFPVWGIYSTGSKRGIMLNAYIGGGNPFHKKTP